jgi:lantibiotic modifying enzyme
LDLTPWSGSESANICHGDVGHLAILLRFANETAIPGMDARIALVTDRIMARYRPDYTFGFKDRTESGELTGDPGLLNGTAGICMALGAAVGSAAPAWDRVLLNS